MSQLDKARRFRALHAKGSCFVMPNPWDAGSAKLLASLGFDALATTSAGCAFGLGKPDGEMAMAADQAFDNARQIVQATPLPVSGDLENGWCDAPEDVAAMIDRAVRVGLAGGSIEDSTARPESPIYELAQAADRIEAAAEASRRSPVPFVLTARAENYLHGRPHLDDTILRLQAYQEAGADVLYAPGLRSLEEIASVVSSVDAPVNVLMGVPRFEATVHDLAEIGVTRISLGSSLARAALGQLHRAATEVLREGTFSFCSDAMTHAGLNELFRDGLTAASADPSSRRR